MFRRPGENLRSIYILLFLNVAFFMMQFQDAGRYVSLFRFQREAFMAGQYWRVLTWQFIHTGGIGPFVFHPAVALFLNLILLTIMGSAVEEEWGTWNFLTFYLISTFASAGIAAALGIPLIGSYFISFTVLFVYASMYPEQTFYLIFIPIRVTWLALFALTMLVIGVFMSTANVAALGGAAAGYIYFLWHRRLPSPAPKQFTLPTPEAKVDAAVAMQTRNAARYAAMRKALQTQSAADIDRLIAQSEREIIRGVNICPPVDYKPEASDGYCLRCEGFAECSARYLRLNRPAPQPGDSAPEAAPI